MQFLGPHINCGHLRHDGGAKTGIKREAFVFARLDIRPGFKARRGGRQYHLRPIDRGTQHGQITGVIQHAILLLIRRVVFFIDNDQAKVLIGQE